MGTLNLNVCPNLQWLQVCALCEKLMWTLHSICLHESHVMGESAFVIWLIVLYRHSLCRGPRYSSDWWGSSLVLMVILEILHTRSSYVTSLPLVALLTVSKVPNRVSVWTHGRRCCFAEEHSRQMACEAAERPFVFRTNDYRVNAPQAKHANKTVPNIFVCKPNFKLK